jgi:hypothetical protein
VFAPDAAVGSDVVAFVYDQAVLGTVTQGSHAIYTSGGATNNAAFCQRSTDNNSIIGCGFADNTLSQATYVGGNVLAGAVTGADTLAQPNQADEVGATPSAGPTTGAGLTDGPDLTGVAINTTTSAFGTPVYSATYTFDESTSNNAVQSPTAPTVAGTTPANGAANSPEGVYLSALHLYTSDGIRLDCTSLSNGAGDSQDDAVLAARDTTTNKTVTCTTYAVGGTGGAGASVTTPAATQTQLHNAVVGTVEFGAVDDLATGGDVSPEGAKIATGSGGTPAT